MNHVTMKVVVHKANVPMLKGETLRQFTQALSDSGQVYLRRKLNLLESDGAFMLETMADKAVFEVYQSKAVNGMPRCKYYALKFTRKSDGAFEFGESVEVRRITSYEPITKSAEGSAQVQKEAWVEAEPLIDWHEVL